MENYNYRLRIEPKMGTTYNPIHDENNGARCVGYDIGFDDRAWIELEENDRGKYIHTSPVLKVTVDTEYVLIETMYSYYYLNKI